MILSEQLNVPIIKAEMHNFFTRLLPIVLMTTGLWIFSNLDYIFSEKTDPKNKNITTDESPRHRNNEVRGYACCFCNADIEETLLEPVYITLGFNHDVGGGNSRDVVYYFS